mmetsp:Transcript_63382/g.196356  ORF Transcript_63382/g.196356 Transcript_63382/m.196356 type:complete len:265 (-) Transcript_63382:882-1676(-)
MAVLEPALHVLQVEGRHGGGVQVLAPGDRGDEAPDHGGRLAPARSSAAGSASPAGGPGGLLLRCRMDEATPQGRADLRRSQLPVRAGVLLAGLPKTLLPEHQNSHVRECPRHALVGQVIGREQDRVLTVDLVPAKDPPLGGQQALVHEDHLVLHRDGLVLAIDETLQGPDDLQERVLLQVPCPVDLLQDGLRYRRLQHHLALQPAGDVGLEELLLMVDLAHAFRHHHVLAQLPSEGRREVPVLDEAVQLIHGLLELRVVRIKLR